MLSPAAPPTPTALTASASAERRLAMVEALAELSMQVAQVCGREALQAAAGLGAARGVQGAAEAETRAAAPEVASEGAPLAEGETVHPEFNPVVVAEAKAAASSSALTVASLAAAHGEAMLAFSRAARAAQMSVALWERLERRQAMAAAAAERAAVEDRRVETEARRARAERVVARIAEDQFEVVLPGEDNDAAAGAAVRFAVGEARVRLGDEDLYRDLPDHPFSEIVERICRDVGLSPDWARLGGEDWAQAELAADPAGPLGPTVGRPLQVSAGLDAVGRAIAGAGARPPWRTRAGSSPPSPRRRRRFEAQEALAEQALADRAEAEQQARARRAGLQAGGHGRVGRQGRLGFQARPPPVTSLKIAFVDGKGNVYGPDDSEPPIPPEWPQSEPPPSKPSPPEPPLATPRLAVRFP